MSWNISPLYVIMLCYFAAVDRVTAKECAKISLSSTQNKTSTCESNTRKVNGDFIFICVADDSQSEYEAFSVCSNLRTLLLEILKEPEKSSRVLITVLMNVNISIDGKETFTFHRDGPESDVRQGLLFASQALITEAVERKIVVVVSYTKAEPCLRQPKCKEFVEKMYKDKFDVYFVDIDERKYDRPLSDKHIAYDASVLTNRIEHLPIFEDYASNCICEQFFLGWAADNLKGLSASDAAAPKKVGVGRILMISAPIAALIIVVIVVIVVYVKKKKASGTKQPETKSKSSVHSKVEGSSQTKKLASPAPAGPTAPAAPDKQPDGGGRQRKVDDYLLLSAHTADNKSKKA